MSALKIFHFVAFIFYATFDLTPAHRLYNVFVDMKSVKLKQFAVSLLAILSLFASSVSACACSHHQEKPEVSPASCHGHPAETKTGQNHGGKSS